MPKFTSMKTQVRKPICLEAGHTTKVVFEKKQASPRRCSAAPRSFRVCEERITQRKIQEEATQLEARNAHLRDLQKELAAKKQKVEALIAGLTINSQEKIP